MLPSNLQFPIELEWRPVPLLKFLQQNGLASWKFVWKFVLGFHLVVTAFNWSDGWQKVLLYNLWYLVVEVGTIGRSIFKDWRAQDAAKAFRLRLDEDGVTKQTDTETRFVSWDEIYHYEDNLYTKFNSNSTLYGKEGEVLLEWNARFISSLDNPTNSNRVIDVFAAIIHQLSDLQRLQVKPDKPIASKTVNNRANVLGWTLLFVGYVIYRQSHTVPGGVAFLVWVLFCGALIVRNQTLFVSPEGVEVRSLFKTQRLFWKQIQRVQLSPSREALTFYTSDSAVVYRFRTFVSVKNYDKEWVLDIIRDNCEFAQIPCSANIQSPLSPRPISSLIKGDLYLISQENCKAVDIPPLSNLR